MNIRNIMKKITCAFLCAIAVLAALPIPKANATSYANYAGITAKLDEVIKQYPDNTYWKSSFDGASTCYGFAKLVVYNVFGKSTTPGKVYRSWLYDGSSSSGMSIVDSTTSLKGESMKQLLLNARPGDVLQLDKGINKRQHSIIIYSVADSGVTIYESNVPNYLTRLHFVAFDYWSNRDNRKATLLRSDNYDEINENLISCGFSSDTVITLSQDEYPSKTHTHGKNFGIRGIVSCNSGTISEVYGAIIEQNGKVVQSCVYHPNTSSHNLRYSINNDLIFGKLSPGSYTYYVQITVNDRGTTSSQTIISYPFSVR